MNRNATRRGGGGGTQGYSIYIRTCSYYYNTCTVHGFVSKFGVQCACRRVGVARICQHKPSDQLLMRHAIRSRRRLRNSPPDTATAYETPHLVFVGNPSSFNIT